MRLPKKQCRTGSWLVVALAAALTIATTGLAASPAAKAATYWGGTISGSVYGLTGDAPWNQAVQGRFEADAGKHITMVNTGESWATFDAATLKEALAGGAIPLVTMGLQGQTLQEIAAGGQDTQIRTWARAAKAFGYPFLFRPWWEMNGEWFAWGRSPYFVPAWRHFHEIVEEVGATNVTWAWVPNTFWPSDPSSDPTPYYPGSAYVDWVGMDAYNFGTNPLQSGSTWMTPAQLIGPTLEVLNRIAPGKPVCLCETASTEIGGNKATWITEFLQSYLPSQPSIQAVLWFNNNIEAAGGSRWDWPIESSASAQKAFHEGIQNSMYLSSAPTLTPLTKVPLPNQTPVPAPAGTVAPAPPTSKAKGSRKKPAPPAKVRFLDARLNPRAGTATVKVYVPRPGTVRLSGKQLTARVRWPDKGRWSTASPLPIVGRLRRPGKIELMVGSTGPALRSLLKTGTTEIVLKVGVKTAKGKVIVGQRSLTLRQNGRG